MQPVDLIDDLEHSLVSHYFFGRVDPQVYSIFQLDKVGSVATEHHEVVYLRFIVGVEVFS